MVDLGYDTHNSIVNLGSLGLLSFLYCIKVIVYIVILMPLVGYSRNKSLLKVTMFLKRSLFFTEFITIT